MNKNYNNQSEEESLARSHSKVSNAKLTLLCIVTILFVSAFWAVLGLKGVLDTAIWAVALAVTAGVSVLCLIGFRKFTR